VNRLRLIGEAGLIGEWFCAEHPRETLVFAQRGLNKHSDDTSLLICRPAYCPRCWREQQADILANGLRRARASTPYRNRIAA
jgi:hypothetical protein